MKAIVLLVLLAMLACIVICAGCSSTGEFVNPMEGVKLNMNIPITKAPNSFIDPNAPAAVTAMPTTPVNETVVPTSTYVFRYE